MTFKGDVSYVSFAVDNNCLYPLFIHTETARQLRKHRELDMGHFFKPSPIILKPTQPTTGITRYFIGCT